MRGRQSPDRRPPVKKARCPISCPTVEKPSGHAFISYVREDSDRVDELQRNLEAAGISVWRDTADLWPGEDWRLKIRRAITDNALVFLACFSSRSAARATSYQNEELLLAIDQLRRRRPDDPWFIPVRFDDCPVPDYDLGGGRILASIQRVDLYGQQRDAGITRLVITIQRRLEQHLPAQETAQSRSITPNPPPWTAATRSAPSPSRTHPSASPTSGHRTIAAPPHHYARILTSHQAAVVGVAFSPDGTLLATSGYDRAARLWDPATGRFISGFTCHMGPVGAVAFSPDGTLLATSGGETARLWKVATGQLTRTLTGHQKWWLGWRSARTAPCSPPPATTRKHGFGTWPLSGFGTWPPGGAYAPSPATERRWLGWRSARTAPCSPPPATTRQHGYGACDISPQGIVVTFMTNVAAGITAWWAGVGQ